MSSGLSFVVTCTSDDYRMERMSTHAMAIVEIARCGAGTAENLSPTASSLLVGIKTCGCDKSRNRIVSAHLCSAESAHLFRNSMNDGDYMHFHECLPAKSPYSFTKHLFGARCSPHPPPVSPLPPPHLTSRSIFLPCFSFNNLGALFLVCLAEMWEEIT